VGPRYGLYNIIFESDLKVLVDAVHSVAVGISEFSSIVLNIRGLLSSISNFEVKFFRHQANILAHNLVKVASSSAIRQVFFFYFVPPCIYHYLINDMS